MILEPSRSSTSRPGSAGPKDPYDGIKSCNLCAHVFSNYIEIDTLEQLKRSCASPLKSPLARCFRNEDWIRKAKTSSQLCLLHSAYKNKSDFITYWRNAVENKCRVVDFDAISRGPKADRKAYMHTLERFVFERYEEMAHLVRQGMVRDAQSLVQRWNSRVDKVGEQCQEKAAKVEQNQRWQLFSEKIALQKKLDSRRMHYSKDLLEAFAEEPRLRTTMQFGKLKELYQQAKAMEQDSRQNFYSTILAEKQRKELQLQAQQEKTRISLDYRLKHKQKIALKTTQAASEKLQKRVEIALEKLQQEQKAEWNAIKLIFIEHLARLENLTQCNNVHVHQRLYQPVERLSFKDMKLAPPMVRGSNSEFATSVLKAEMRVFEHKRIVGKPGVQKRPKTAQFIKSVIQNVRRRGDPVSDAYSLVIESAVLGPSKSRGTIYDRSSSSSSSASSQECMQRSASASNIDQFENHEQGLRPKTAHPQSKAGMQGTRAKLARPSTAVERRSPHVDLSQGLGPASQEIRQRVEGDENLSCLPEDVYENLGSDASAAPLQKSESKNEDLELDASSAAPLPKSEPKIEDLGKLEQWSRNDNGVPGTTTTSPGGKRLAAGPRPGTAKEKKSPYLTPYVSNRGRRAEVRRIRSPEGHNDNSFPCAQCGADVESQGLPLSLYQDADITGEGVPLTTCCSVTCILAWNNVCSPPSIRDSRKERILSNFSTPAKAVCVYNALKEKSNVGKNNALLKAA